MPCTSPLPAWRPAGSSGRPQIFKGEHGEFEAFCKSRPELVESFFLDCGGCLSCRIAKQRDLAVRAMHESVLWPEDQAWFVTLTYNDEHLPPGGTLEPRDLTLFLKRFRKRHGAGIKYLGCGEYGENGTLRPHYHLCLWGHSFTDRKRWKLTYPKFPGGPRYWLYRSADLERAWSTKSGPIGHAWLGKLTHSSAAYVASYTTKKLNGHKQNLALLRSDGRKVWRVTPEFSRISRGGRAGKGLGYGFYERYFTDLFPKDFVVHPRTGRKLPVPRYYRRQLEEDPRFCRRVLARELREKRIARASDIWEDTPELRAARDATLRSERKLYGHPDDYERLDSAARDRVNRFDKPRREIPGTDALANQIREATR